jgi:hypothetical protein
MRFEKTSRSSASANLTQQFTLKMGIKDEIQSFLLGENLAENFVEPIE